VTLIFSQEHKKEDDELKAFYDSCFKQSNMIIQAIPLDTASISREPDYLLREINSVVEIKTFIHQQITADIIRNERIKVRLRKALASNEMSFSRGIYTIPLPNNLRINSENDATIFIEQVLNAINKNEKSFNLPNVGKVYIDKHQDTGQSIIFGDSSTACENPSLGVFRSIEKAGNQLGKYSQYCKILLFVSSISNGDLPEYLKNEIVNHNKTTDMVPDKIFLKLDINKYFLLYDKSSKEICCRLTEEEVKVVEG